jgi:hypothetical protein
VLWRYFDRHNAEMVNRFPKYSEFEEFYTRPRNTLNEYLELHTLVESVQTVETLPYFIYRLMRGAYVFENLAYLELRYTPYLRTPEHLDQSERIDLMAEIVQVVGKASQISDCPIVTSQILCMHSRLPYEVNRAIVDLAAGMGEYVCAIDIAGGDAVYWRAFGGVCPIVPVREVDRHQNYRPPVRNYLRLLSRTSALSDAYRSRDSNSIKISRIAARSRAQGSMLGSLPDYLSQNGDVAGYARIEGCVRSMF